MCRAADATTFAGRTSFWAPMCSPPIPFMYSAPTLFSHKRANLYMDNDPAANALIRGDCANPFRAAMVRTFWKLVGKYSVDVWIGRVGSEMNPSDLPTMRVKRPFKTPVTAQFKNRYKILNETLISQTSYNSPPSFPSITWSQATLFFLSSCVHSFYTSRASHRSL